MVWWGANFDDMLTFPPYFAQEIQPWIRKAADTLGAAGKLVLCHTDGENRGLMDLIRDSGMHIAESFCPAPMTKVTLAEYYRHWRGHLTLFGGIPSTVVMPGTSEADFEAYMDELFRAVAPGQRIVIGVADEVPPSAVFSRLQRIGERIEKEGRLPLQAGAFRPAPAAAAPAPPGPPPRPQRRPPATRTSRSGRTSSRASISTSRRTSRRCSIAACRPADILEHGLIAAITVVGDRMAAGDAFIPEVLLAARAMAASPSTCWRRGSPPAASSSAARC